MNLNDKITVINTILVSMNADEREYLIKKIFNDDCIESFYNLANLSIYKYIDKLFLELKEFVQNSNLDNLSIFERLPENQGDGRYKLKIRCNYYGINITYTLIPPFNLHTNEEWWSIRTDYCKNDLSKMMLSTIKLYDHVYLPLFTYIIENMKEVKQVVLNV